MTRIAHPKFLKGCIVRASTQAHPTPWRDMQEPQRSGRRRNEAERRQSDQNKFIGLYLSSAVAAFKARTPALS
jgi:hypothetical protein